LEALISATHVPELPEGPLAPLQVRWAKKSKRKKMPKMADRTPEQKTIAAGRGENRLEDLMYNPESPYTMSLQIKNHLRGLTSDGRHNVRRKKDLSRYTNYRVLRIAGQTHDTAKEDVDRRGFATPLTELQDNANLPRSPLHRRFNFPHTFNYKVYWGPPSVEEEPNAYEGSMVSCAVAVRLQDLPLTARQKQRLLDIVGPNMVDEETGVVALEVDNFTERNQNAALLGDMLEQLLREAVSADDTLEKRSHFDSPELREASESSLGSETGVDISR
jgi:hypothetical protein